MFLPIDTAPHGLIKKRMNMKHFWITAMGCAFADSFWLLKDQVAHASNCYAKLLADSAVSIRDGFCPINCWSNESDNLTKTTIFLLITICLFKMFTPNRTNNHADQTVQSSH